jgi:hypothetical protein
LELPLIANFARVDDSIAARKAHVALAATSRASVVGLDLANTVATITSERVAIVALLAVLIDLAITATGWSLHRAGGWRIRDIAVHTRVATGAYVESTTDVASASHGRTAAKARVRAGTEWGRSTSAACGAAGNERDGNRSQPKN